MAEQETTGIGWFIAGLGLGALLGILFAPKAGRERWSGIVDRVSGNKNDAERSANDEEEPFHGGAAENRF